MSSDFPTNNKPIAPTKPIKIPTTLIHLVFDLNNNTPKSKVNNGVSEFNIPVSELLIPVSALVNKNAGIKLPSTPIPTNAFQCFNNGFLTCLKINGDKKRKAMKILNAATSSLE